MAAHDPGLRSVIGTIGGNTRAATAPDRMTMTAEALKKTPSGLPYWITQVDPDQVMPEDERLARATNAWRAYQARLSLLGVQARARKKQERAEAAAVAAEAVHASLHKAAG